MRFSILTLVACVALAAPAFAAKEPAAGGKDAHAKTKLLIKDGDKYRDATENEVKEAAHGFQHPLDFTGFRRYDLGIYTLIVFGALVVILGKFAWPHITEGLKKREAAILGAHDEAQKSRTEAEETRTKLQKDYAEAQDKIRAMLDEARRDSDSLKATEKEAGIKAAAEERDRARREIQAEKDAVLQDLYRQAVDLAALLSAKTIRRELSPDDHRRLLDESLAELKGATKA